MTAEVRLMVGRPAKFSPPGPQAVDLSTASALNKRCC